MMPSKRYHMKDEGRLGVGEMAQWFQGTGVQFPEPTWWVTTILYHVTIICSPGIQHPLLTSKGTRHACGADTYAGKTSIHTIFSKLKKFTLIFFLREIPWATEVLSEAVRPGGRSSTIYASSDLEHTPYTGIALRHTLVNL